MSEPEGEIKPEVCVFLHVHVWRVCSHGLIYISTSCIHIVCICYALTTQLNYVCVSVQDLKFTLAVTKMKGYFEAFFEQPPPFKLSLIEINTEETVWSAIIREGISAFSLPLQTFGDLRVKSILSDIFLLLDREQ